MKDRSVVQIIDTGTKRFFQEYGVWPDQLTLGDKWLDQVVKWNGGKKIHRLWGINILHSTDSDHFELAKEESSDQRTIREAIESLKH